MTASLPCITFLLLWHTEAVELTVRTYIPGESPIHHADARMKFTLLLVFSVAVFFVETWAGLGVMALVVAIAIAVSGLPWGRMAALSLPLLFILLVIWLCNAFALDVTTIQNASSLAGVSAGFAAGWQPVALVGTFGFVPEGCMRGLFYAVRILLILFASFVVTFTTTAEALTAGFASMLAPLRTVRVPVDDIALMLSLALRFIPLTAEELDRIQKAQLARAADFNGGGAWCRILSWQTVFVPLVVALFRRANNLGEAMDARCYGAQKRTSLNQQHLTPAQVVVLVGGMVLCVALAVVA